MGKGRHHKQQHVRHNANNSKNASSANASRKNGNAKSDSSSSIPESQNDDESSPSFLWKHKLKLFVSMPLFFQLGLMLAKSQLKIGATRHPSSDWQLTNGEQIRSFGIFRFFPFLSFLDGEDDSTNVHTAKNKYIDFNGMSVRDDPSHPFLFAVLRESIVREEGGFVHPDLGLLNPAPSGAARGLGMVSDTYNACQTRCMPGISVEKLNSPVDIEEDENDDDDFLKHPPFWDSDHVITNTREKLTDVLDAQLESEQKYTQEEVLLRIPLSIQMTRTLALHTLTPLLPLDVQSRVPLQELDDAALLVLLLAHEKGLGRESIFQSYIATLPLNPSCGYSPLLRDEVLETILSMGVDMDMDVNGWPGEINKAAEHAELIAEGLAKDYGQFISVTKGVTPFARLQWALCQVASRATAGSEKHGGLRMVPMMDMINHDVNAGGFVELTGAERLEDGDAVDAFEDDSGTFIVRSIRHGRRKPLKKGQELLVNYNVPSYSPLDWCISLGFVPPEKSKKWVLVEGALPKGRSHGTQSSRYRTPQPTDL